jgi:hypothetical protein
MVCIVYYKGVVVRHFSTNFSAVVTDEQWRLPICLSSIRKGVEREPHPKTYYIIYK